ncbi:AMP-binding protein [Nocardia takedensis]|uniref:AMP-binding protein n=1 Tax=Nocardia takedensis TaxID=259390 RepID=UPI00030A7177|nr:class I adenylate-forming enzyme family protein [Nocardia takedensis]
MILQRLGNRGLYLGELFAEAALRNPHGLVMLNHRLDVAPELGTTITVADCARVVEGLAVALRAAGVGAGAKVAIHKSDGFDIFLLACAVNRAGGVPVCLSPALTGETVGELLTRCAGPFLVTDEATLVERLDAGVRGRARAVLVVAGEVEGTTPLRPDTSRPLDYTRPDRHQPMLVTHTSGTTGVPKLVVHTAWTMRARYRPQAAGARLLLRGREAVAIQVSFVHSRLVTALAVSLRRGFPLVILRDSPAADNVGLLARFRPGVFEAHPNALIEWEELAEHPAAPLRNLTLLSTTFDAVHPRTVLALLAASRRRFPLHVQLYGQSEIGPTVVRLSTKFRKATADWRCVGYAFPGATDVRVVERDGRRATRAAPGPVQALSDGRAVTYLEEDDRYHRQVDGRWWAMGDVGYRSRWGCLHLSDREVDLIPGIDSTLRVEDELLARMDSLAEVVLVRDERQRPVPVVVTRDERPLDRAAWERAVAGLPTLCEPIQLPMRRLPRTGTGKTRRLELSRMLFAVRS